MSGLIIGEAGEAVSGGEGVAGRDERGAAAGLPRPRPRLLRDQPQLPRRRGPAHQRPALTATARLGGAVC